MAKKECFAVNSQRLIQTLSPESPNTPSTPTPNEANSGKKSEEDEERTRNTTNLINILKHIFPARLQIRNERHPVRHALEIIYSQFYTDRMRDGDQVQHGVRRAAEDDRQDLKPAANHPKTL